MWNMEWTHVARLYFNAVEAVVVITNVSCIPPPLPLLPGTAYPSWQPILSHIDAQFEDYLNQESRVTRGMSSDRRVHCCLYFIRPNGHG